MGVRKSPQAVDIEVGRRVRERRVLAGISQEKLGQALGVTFQQVQKYEKGTNRIGASRLQQIAEALGVAPAYFFPETDAPATIETPQDPLTIRVAQNFARITNRALRLSLAKTIAAAAHVEEEAA